MASGLLDAVDEEALARGRTLLLLDTETGSAAESLYRARGWQPYGFVPGHALRPDATMGDTTFMLLALAARDRLMKQQKHNKKRCNVTLR